MAVEMTIQELAEKLAESFVNGNREYVCNQLMSSFDYERSEAVAITAAVVVKLNDEHKVDFIKFLEHWA